MIRFLNLFYFFIFVSFLLVFFVFLLWLNAEQINTQNLKAMSDIGALDSFSTKAFRFGIDSTNSYDFEVKNNEFFLFFVNNHDK